LGAPLSFEKLDLASLVVGELLIISDYSTPPDERKARISQLIRICNHARNFDWKCVREFHGAFLSEIETSRSGDWGCVNIHDLAAQYLYSAKKPGDCGRSSFYSRARRHRRRRRITQEAQEKELRRQIW